MAITVTTDSTFNLINTCENALDWVGESPSDVSDFFQQGTQCVGFNVRGNGNNDITLTVTENLSGVTHLRCWYLTTVVTESEIQANGGVQFWVSDGSNTGYWYVSGRDTYPGGWYPLVVNLANAVDAGTKPDMTVITTMGLRFVHSGVAKNAQNTWVDHVYTCNGIIAYGDIGGNPFDLDDVLTEDADPNNGWGIVRKIGGVFFLTGSIQFGDSGGSNACDFLDTNETIVFEDRPVHPNLYNWRIIDNATALTEFVCGTKSGTSGTSGVTIRLENTDQSARWSMIASDPDLDNFKLYGCNFSGAGTIFLPLNSADVEVLSCTFNQCDEVLPSTCVVVSCFFISATDRGLRLEVAHNVTDCTFIVCGHCLHIPLSENITIDGFTFIGSDGVTLWDADHSVSGHLTVNAVESNINNTFIEHTITSPPPWHTGSSTVNNSVNVNITVLDEAAVAIENAAVGVFQVGDETQVMNELTTAAGLATEVFNYTGHPTDILIRVRKSSTGSTRYFSVLTTAKISSNGLDLTTTLIADGIVSA